MRILGLDIGDKKIGISMSDPTHTLAQTLEVPRRTTFQADLQELSAIIADHGIGDIVVNTPRIP